MVRRYLDVVAVAAAADFLDEDKRGTRVEFVVNLAGDADAVSFTDDRRRQFHSQRVMASHQRTCQQATHDATQ